MRLIDADWLLSFIRLDEKVIAPEQHTAQDIIMMVQAAPTIEPPPNDPMTLEELREMGGEPYWHVGLQKGSVPPHWNILEPFAAKHIENFCYGKNWLAYRRKPTEGEN